MGTYVMCAYVCVCVVCLCNLDIKIQLRRLHTDEFNIMLWTSTMQNDSTRMTNLSMADLMKRWNHARWWCRVMMSIDDDEKEDPGRLKSTQRQIIAFCPSWVQVEPFSQTLPTNSSQHQATKVARSGMWHAHPEVWKTIHTAHCEIWQAPCARSGGDGCAQNGAFQLSSLGLA